MTIRDALRDAPIEAVREVQRQAEAFLDGTVQMALAADQRATTMAGICGAGAIALAAAVAGLLSAANVNLPLISGAAVTATLLYLASLIFAKSAAPVYFHVRGYQPKKLGPSCTNLTWALIHTTEDFQSRIEFNKDVLERSARSFKWASFVAVAALPCGLIAFCAVIRLF